MSRLPYGGGRRSLTVRLVNDIRNHAARTHAREEKYTKISFIKFIDRRHTWERNIKIGHKEAFSCFSYMEWVKDE
jgi:hypothetical protein